MGETKKCKKKARLPWKTKDFLTITSFVPWKTTIKVRNNSFFSWKTLKKETKSIRLPWKMTTKIKNITEIRQLDTVRDESYRALQFTVQAAKHRCAVDEVEKVMRRYLELAVQSNNKVMLRMGVLSIILFIWEKKSA